MLTKAVRGAIINFAKALLLQTSSYGGVAHLVERLLRMQEVRGSIPLISTKTHRYELFWFRNVFGLTRKLPQR